MTVAALSVRGCGTIAFSPAMRSTPAWSSTSQPAKPAPPSVFGAVSCPMMTSSNDEPESASVSCQRSRLTTTWIGTPTRLLLISMSSSAGWVSY